MKWNKFIAIAVAICFTQIASGQNTGKKSDKSITITGVVLNVAKEPIVNAIIMIDDKKTSSVTDSRGYYKIKVKRSALKIGIFSFGNGMLEEAIEGRTLINLSFKTMATQQQNDQTIAPGEEGVNVGYGYVKKKNLTTDVIKIDGTDKKYASYASIYDMIQRKYAGIRINGGNIIIQDSKNLWGSIPALLIVDGVYVSSIGDISPASVKSIEILKGSSAAIYGSRGYGGVVLIVTRIKIE